MKLMAKVKEKIGEGKWKKLRWCFFSTGSLSQAR
jgi:hypothetical protein